VAYAWTQQRLADNAREIHALGRDLFERLGTMSGHLDRLGRSLNAAVSAYNRAVGSLENRVLVSARRFEDLGVAGDELASPEPVVDVARPLTAAELLDSVADVRPELPELDEKPTVLRRVAT
jgi:DNA recombination protein RmuC